MSQGTDQASNTGDAFVSQTAAVVNDRKWLATTSGKQWLGLVGILIFSFGALAGVGIANIGIASIVLALIWAWREVSRVLFKQPLFWLGLLQVSYLLLHGSIAEINQPPWMAAVPEGISRTIRISAWPALAVALGLSLIGPVQWRYLWRWLPTLVAAGMFARIFSRWEPGMWDRFVAGTKLPTFGDSHINFAMWMVVSLIGLACALPWFYLRPRHRFVWIVGLLVLLTMTVFGSALLVLSISRAAWLVGAALLPAVVIALLYVYRQKIHRPAMAGLCSALFLVALVTPPLGFYQAITQRWAQESETITHMVTGDWHEAELNSLGMRLYMYREGWQYWQEHPVLGWGPRSAPFLLSQVDEPTVAKQGFKSFHNGYLTMMVEYGVVGLALLVIQFGGLLWVGVQGIKNQRTDERVGVFALGALATIILNGVSGGVFGGYRGPYLMALVGGLLYAWRLGSISERVDSLPPAQA